MKTNPPQSDSLLTSLSPSQQKQLSTLFNQDLLNQNANKHHSSLLERSQNKIRTFFYCFDAETSTKINNLFTYLPINEQLQVCKQVQQLKTNYDAMSLFVMIGAILAPKKLLSKGLLGIAALAFKGNVGDRVIQFKLFQAAMKQNKHNQMLQEMRNILMFYGSQLIKKETDPEANEPLREMMELMEEKTRDYDIYKKNKDLL